MKMRNYALATSWNNIIAEIIMFIINIQYINIIIIYFILRNTFFNAFYQEKIQKFKLTFFFFFFFNIYI